MLKARRVVYLHDVASMKENEMLYKFVVPQCTNPIMDILSKVALNLDPLNPLTKLDKNINYHNYIHSRLSPFSISKLFFQIFMFPHQFTKKIVFQTPLTY